ncbi:hypothetical protein P280DRAFT_537751 [Massarina eburnea CBS 473.64]|uniref:Uncharacterized protein n=1 Tax=Massarina eburnea CBS 473.64 TaxID=1395130 RepID=A0A6A6SA15_9PLEO|nr:hypothetical protein P280DRAFT_537751 [Massarina eburnea CBS 473.64]
MGSRNDPSANLFPRGLDCTIARDKVQNSIAFGRSDTVFITFYPDHVLPFLFPFYNPCMLEGGNSWILEIVLSSPEIRKVIMCQSSYFFTLSRGTAQGGGEQWGTLLTQTREPFDVMRQALHVIQNSNIREHIPGSVRILRSIISNFNAVMLQLGPSSWVLLLQSLPVPSAEQIAFCFSSTFLFDDIITSTILQGNPTLYAYHCSLLRSTEDTEPLINFEALVSCHNWVLLGISEIAVLDAWKQRSKKVGNLNMIEFVNRATAIKTALETSLSQLVANTLSSTTGFDGLLDVSSSPLGQRGEILTKQVTLVTRVWAHAALLYLCVVVSGWQPVSVDIRYHVNCIVQTLTEKLQHASVFGTVRKALEIMEGSSRTAPFVFPSSVLSSA